MQAIAGVAALVEQVERTGAQRVAQPARLSSAPLGQFRLALDHFGRWRPGRPFALHRDPRATLPFEALAPDADAVPHGPAFGPHKIKKLLLGIDDARAGLLVGPVGNS